MNARVDETAARPSLLRRVFRRGLWENAATGIIALGVVMLCQPFVIDLYTYSFVTTLAGTIMFVIVSKFPD
jgi:hypothetical protein